FSCFIIASSSCDRGLFLGGIAITVCSTDCRYGLEYNVTALDALNRDV
ncbi:23993_t:CDS:1, partial [Racocetra persica]